MNIWSTGLHLYICVFSSYIAGKVFSRNGQNPGVGGTQYSAVRLGIQLAASFPDLTVVLVNPVAIPINLPPENLKQESAESLEELLVRLSGRRERKAVISTLATLKGTPTRVLKDYRTCLIAWIHHPFTFDARLRSCRLAAHVCVGAYQYFANRYYYPRLWHIQNPFTPPLLGPRRCPLPASDRDGPIRIAHLGALIKGKGFLHIAKQWSHIKAALPGAELHVIGSAGVYGAATQNQLIPTDNAYANELLRHIPVGDISSKRVVFYGNLGEEKFEILQECFAAVLNPTGRSEAFPASPLECMAAGLPVIASSDYGMSDSMRFFPELVLERPSDICRTLELLVSNAYLYEELRERSLAVAKWFGLQDPYIAVRWRRLIEYVCGTGPEPGQGQPMFDRYGSCVRLFTRVGFATVRSGLSLLTDNDRKGG